MLNVCNLTKKFSSKIAVDNVSFRINPGEIVGFLGPNGAGKSTTMKMLTGFLNPTSGQVIVDGKLLSSNKISIQQDIGYLPEGAPAYEDMTVISFLRFIAEVRGFHGALKKVRIDNVVQATNLQSVLHEPIEYLSKGFKRRLGLAQAIIHDPKILILDEPTDGLDPNQKQEVRKLIRNMAEDKIIILSTHILEEVDALCTRTIIISGGKIIADSNLKELIASSPLANVLHIRVRNATIDAVRSNLMQLDHIIDVQCVETKNKDLLFKIQAEESKNALLLEISKFMVQHDWEFVELLRESKSLDEVFRITTEKHQAAS